MREPIYIGYDLASRVLIKRETEGLVDKPAKTRQRELTAIQIELLTLHREGRTVKQIASAMGICESNVREKLKAVHEGVRLGRYTNLGAVVGPSLFDYSNEVTK